MVFYRGEIHVIKMIGDYPGVYSTEIARRYGITRAVIHKTLLNLEKRGLVKKEQDKNDKKRVLLFLTEKGEKAYCYHAKYHNKHDRALFDYMEQMNEKQLEGIVGFLEHANHLIQKHK